MRCQLSFTSFFSHIANPSSLTIFLCVTSNACIVGNACTAGHALCGPLVASICVAPAFVLELVLYTHISWCCHSWPFFMVILTATLREIAAVFVMLGCCEFRNKMYKYSCWVSLFLYFCAPVFCYCFVNCKYNHRVFITHGWHTFRHDATGKIITISLPDPESASSWSGLNLCWPNPAPTLACVVTALLLTLLFFLLPAPTVNKREDWSVPMLAE